LTKSDQLSIFSIDSFSFHWIFSAGFIRLRTSSAARAPREMLHLLGADADGRQAYLKATEASAATCRPPWRWR